MEGNKSNNPRSKMEGNKSNNPSIPHSDKKRKLQDELSEKPSPKKIQCDTRGASRPESMNSNSPNFNDDEAKTNLQYEETCSSDFPTSTSADTSCEFSLYSSDTNSSVNPCYSSEAESFSTNEQPHCSNSDFGFSEHKKGSDDQESVATELEDLLYSSAVASSSNNFVLSSGRWPVNQDSQQAIKKLTIDKEFEQYFSKLMV